MSEFPLRDERISIVRDAVSFKKTSRIPTFSNYYTYMILEAGDKLSEAFYDYDRLFEIVTGFVRRYDFDYYNYLGSRNPFPVSDVLGSNHYKVDDERGMLNFTDRELMLEDEYPALTADPKKFYWSVVYRRKYSNFTAEDSFEMFERSRAALSEWNAFVNRTTKAVNEDMQVPLKCANQKGLPVETLFNSLRGIKGFSLDLRRRPEQMKAAIEALSEFNDLQGVYNYISGPQPDNQIFGYATTLLCHSVMNHKQFGELYWPFLSKVINLCAAAGKQMHIFSEAQITSFYDYFQDVPKGVLVIQPEQDDVFELRRKLPNVALNGGMTTVSLGLKSKEECLDLGRRLIDELAADGGFIMGQNKMMTYRNDAKPENILAVQELCRTYTG